MEGTEEGVESLGAGVTGIYDLSNVDTRVRLPHNQEASAV